ncbi:MAG: PepSY domain-containing protein [Acidobacteria bacterium]|nr:PepSY domain-containing protein [Acidobacteriota bacterium]
MRRAFFWLHLVLGVGAGLPILTMCATGTLLALQPQIMDWAEADQRRVTATGAARVSPAAMLHAALATAPSAETLSITVFRDPSASVSVTIGRGDVRYVDPFTGNVLGTGSPRLRRVFQWLTEFHRWFAVGAGGRDTARAVTGWSTAAFVVLAISGAILWIPRRWTRALLVRGIVPGWASTPAARHYNWHTVVGIWCAPVLFMLALTGVIIAFPWASRALYAIAGTPQPPSQGRAESVAPARRAGAHADAGIPQAPDFRRVDAAWTVAEAQLPTWSGITLRIQPRTNGPLSFTITDAAHWNRFARSQLVVDATGSTVVRWEPYTDISTGQRWRGWARFAHTGELGGLAGQVVAGLASAGATLLVYTGFSLAIRRLTRRISTGRARAA